MQNYKFICRCRVCNIPRTAVPESNRRRNQISYLSYNSADLFYDWFIQVSEEKLSAGSLIKTYQILLTLLDEERMDEGRGVPIRWLANIYAALGSSGMFKRWAKEAAEYIPCMSTRDSFCDGEVWKRWLEDPSTHPLWNLRRHWRK